MPEPVANNAFIEGYAGDTLCYYSFTGIGSELSPQDIHLKAWRYNTLLDQWQALPDVNDFRGKVAAGASRVDSIIYVIGGYHVFNNFNEQTSGKVHRFNTQTNMWLEDGADIPVPTDDHVQAVWRDSLIYAISGWSTNTNISDVQIYNPELNEWVNGTPVPASANFRAFGASGTIIGDTIYYFGGVHIAGFNFVANKRFRKGVINPDDPTEITWEYLGEAPVEDRGYRMACTHFQNEAIWIGGAGVAYNFDALAYSNNQVVEPLGQIRTYNTSSQNWATAEPSPFPIMDLRGIAREDEDSWVIGGGITNNREVSDQLWRITRATVGTNQVPFDPVQIVYRKDEIGIRSLGGEIMENAELFNASGISLKKFTPGTDHFVIETLSLKPGIYILKLQYKSGGIQAHKLIVSQ